ncbi:MAG: hypothetical protein JOY90_02345 [Bradyrhizobium sp.]|uniref:hypothetical protein n=1 Tax=Bradyrhizobium sp. TaxID=376 RepID=UPI001D505DB9|nr:hypothetical protein [Bradyrhizobium sp.]MBV9559292.1 hypothetical protein [Bradyrhizobium sp.]
MGSPVEPRFTGIPAHDVAGTAKTVLRIGGPTFVLRNLFSVFSFLPNSDRASLAAGSIILSRPRGG